MDNRPLCLLIVFLASGAYTKNDTVPPRLFKRQTRACADLEFPCGTAFCISRYEVCDGEKHCPDGSDETAAACNRVSITTCPPTSFQCTYGACVSRYFLCDGKNDCSDGSDEYGCGGNRPPATQPNRPQATQGNRPQATQPNRPPATQAASSVCNSASDGSKYSQCNNGQCIDQYSMCDGVIDCSDRSDETETVCYKLFFGRCPGGQWRCSYGACLHKSTRCDGKTDCWDGSDEANCVGNQRPSAPKPITPVQQPVNTPRPVRPQTPAASSPPASSGRTCVVPSPAKNRHFSQLHCQSGCSLAAGQIVAEGGLIVVTCESGHQLSQQNMPFITSCRDGHWYPNIPQCSKLCPVLSAPGVDMLCWQGPNEGCDKAMLPGTTITFKCKEHYETSDRNQPNLIRCNPSGQWSGQLPQCTPKCGQSNLGSYLLPAITGGTVSKAGNFPWHSAIFHKKNQKWEAACGGTLISNKIVLTAAHCVTGRSRLEPPPLDTQDVMIAVGKYYREWDTVEDTDMRVAVKEIRVHPLYRGEPQHYGEDIAVVVLANEVRVNSFVMPACVDYTLTNTDQLEHNKSLMGYIAGWGNTAECSSYGSVCESHSPTLLYTRTSVMSYQQCYLATQSIHPASDSKLTPDKFCAGNGTVSVVQQGDSGGGLTFVFDGAHYLYGVVSTKLKLEINNKPYYSFAAFTSVAFHMDWLSSQLY